ncbi:MAG: DNA gyrase inhibitor YacG [Nitrospirota bacterium]|nr:MAG: DNA gyrase inhibitor YacG [Nitrospirota bacterium]
MKVPCPICRKMVNHQGNPYRPFCSERCKLIDLESWMSQRYRVPVDEEPPDSGESLADQEAPSSNGNH